MSRATDAAVGEFMCVWLFVCLPFAVQLIIKINHHSSSIFFNLIPLASNPCCQRCLPLSCTQGMMDAAYFIGRRELLDFFNTLLELNLAKIEDTASGAVACQMTEMIFPGSIPMSRVNWEARSDYEFVQNYKLLQNAFNKHNVQRYVCIMTNGVLYRF